MTVRWRYSEAERDKLEELAGEMPLGMLARRYNAWASENGLPTRTERALHQCAKKAGMSVEPIGDLVRTSIVLEAIDASQAVVEGWVKRGWIQPVLVRSPSTRPVPNRRRGPTRRSFRRRDLRRLARERPEAFAGASRDGLFRLLEDGDLCDEILARFPRRTSCLQARRPVMCLDTRRRYPSIRAASRDTGLCITLIRSSILKGHRAKGTRWVDATSLIPVAR